VGIPPYARLLALSALLLASVPALAADALAGDPVALGRRLYREGIGVDGQPVTATVQGDVPVTGAQLACAGCHKRSGLGASEGGARALIVTAPLLFGPRSEQPATLLKGRPPYTDQTLRPALEGGRASDGRALDALMPRYRLSDADRSALTAYLRLLGSAADPGVSGTELELATIVSLDAPARDREAVAAVVQRFAALKNRGTRNEGRRAAASRRHLHGERHVRAFRSWHVSVWTLAGPPSGWSAQLEALYAKRPPFAVLSGAAGDNWQVVHDFCERQALPCILPVAPLPPESPTNFYNLYYSAGVRLDAHVTAQSIAQGYDETAGRVLVIYVDDARGRAAHRAFVEFWPAERRANLVARAIVAGTVPSSREWHDILVRERPDVLVAWMAPEQLEALSAAAAGIPTLPGRIYTADSLTDWRTTHAPPAFENRVLHVYPYSLPARGQTQFPREDVWLKSQGLDDLERLAAAQALFACHATGEALGTMADNYSREYLIETLEHMLDGTNMTTLFPVTTLGTGQRYLVKGAYVVRLAPHGDSIRYQPGDWLQP
jgi:mono/diheme cytochrome c family protein